METKRTFTAVSNRGIAVTVTWWPGIKQWEVETDDSFNGEQSFRYAPDQFDVLLDVLERARRACA